MNLKISFAVTACDESFELNRLLTLLHENKRDCDEIVVLLDETNCTDETIQVAESFNIAINKFPLNNDFAKFKNHLNTLCSGDYIFQIDADEMPSIETISNLHSLIESNLDVDLFLVPRINIVEGLTEGHIKKWNWHLNEKNWINWPDFQHRIFKNRFHIKWRNPVHEQIIGAQVGVKLPATTEYALMHNKTIQKQEKQNALYDKIV
jgi:glycosyltransferase involved in cell wall biosynthesis